MTHVYSAALCCQCRFLHLCRTRDLHALERDVRRPMCDIRTLPGRPPSSTCHPASKRHASSDSDWAGRITRSGRYVSLYVLPILTDVVVRFDSTDNRVLAGDTLVHIQRRRPCGTWGRLAVAAELSEIAPRSAQLLALTETRMSSTCFGEHDFSLLPCAPARLNLSRG